MLWLGMDDTDTLDTAGTNKLALHVASLVAPETSVQVIVRYQLLIDPRVPYTSHNGCVSLRIDGPSELSVGDLAARLRPIILDWCPSGSDPGLCVATIVPEEVTQFGLRCQTDVVTQQDALTLAANNGMYVESLGGTGDGVIGALAAVGLLATHNDGRIIHWGNERPHWSDITGSQAVSDLLDWGIAEIRCLETQRRIEHGRVTLSKRLRPNLRDGQPVLFVTPKGMDDFPDAEWQAVKVV